MSALGTNRLPLTAAQLGIWYAQHLDPANPLFSIAEYFEIDGAVAADDLQEALRQVVGEAEALRARFEDGGDGPVQTVEPSVPVTLRRIDLSAEADPRAAARTWLEEEARRPSTRARDRCSPSRCSRSRRAGTSGSTATTTS